MLCSSYKGMFSVIVVCRNSLSMLMHTLENIKCQTYRNFEIVVVDCDSTDGTKEYLNSSKLVSQFISEPDSGVYDAMNKGARMARGEWLVYINAGDAFYNTNVLLDAERRLKPSSDIVYGDVVVNYEGFERVIRANDVNKLIYGMICCHQSMFIKKRLMEKQPYNLGYKIVSDYDFLLGAFLSGSKIQYIDMVVAKFLPGGLSERKRIARDIEVIKVVLSRFNKITFMQFICFSKSLSFSVAVKCINILHLNSLKVALIKARYK